MTRLCTPLPLTHLPTALLACFALTAFGCREPTMSFGLPSPSFQAQPDTVAPGDTFRLAFVLRNPGTRSVTITSSYGCLFFLDSFRGQDRTTLDGTLYYCTTVISSFTLNPGDSLQIVRNIVAAAGGAPLPLGTYRIRTRMNAPLPDVEASVTVVESVGAT